MAHCVAVCNKLRVQFQAEGEAEFCNVITTDMFRMFQYNPELKQQNSQWKTPNVTGPKKSQSYV